MVLDADVNHHKYIFVDEARIDLAKIRHQRATVQVPGQHGGNISMNAATVSLKMVWQDVGDYLAPTTLAISLSFSMKLRRPVKVKGSPM